MKKITLVIGILIVVVAAVYAIYCYGFKKSTPEGTQVEKVQAVLLQSDCYVCHSRTPQLPFYSSFPVIGPMMEQHVQRAVEFLDLDKVQLDPNQVDEVALSMIEYALEEETMPIMQYRMIHWGTSFNDAEEDILEGWIKEARKRFSNGEASQEYAFYAIQPVPESVPFDPQKAALGYKMYNDLRVAKDSTVSCASCHQLENGGADHRGTRTSEGIYGQFGGVNAPTVYNAYFNVQQFWNGRAADLKEQAAGPPANPVEMGEQTLEDIVARLKGDKELVAEFASVYPEEGLTPSSMTDAIAEFEKTLLTPDSRFDLYLKGNENALSEMEEEGFEQFMENGCVACHTGVILGGKSFEKLAIYGDYFADRDSSIVYCADDDGLKGFTGNDEDFQRFKVPGLRNVALTAPYFHDGSVATLYDAVSLMSKYEYGKTLDDKTVTEIVSFLETLTGKNQYLQK